MKKKIGNALFKHDVPFIDCHVDQLSPVGSSNILFQKIGIDIEFDLKAVK